MKHHEIDIKRNVIENFLMLLRDYVRDHRKIFLFSLLGVFLLIVAIIGSFIAYESKAHVDLVEFEKTWESYYSLAGGDANDKAKKIDDIVKKMEKQSESSWGFARSAGKFFIGGIYYSEGKYEQALKYYTAYADENPASLWAILALQQAARSYERLKKFDDALKLYTRLENDHGKSDVADQICFDLARIYAIRGDTFKAREYYYKVVSQFPQSPYSQKAKKNLFLIGDKKSEPKTSVKEK